MRALSALLILLAFTSCTSEKRTEVLIKGNNSVEFELRGTGSLEYFAVYGPSYPAKASEPNDLKLAVWLVAPIRKARAVEEIKTIRYGVVPDGYRQEFPFGKAPEALAKGERYYYHADTLNAPGVSGYVSARAGDWIAVDGEHVCFGNEHGKWFRKPCNQ